MSAKETTDNFLEFWKNFQWPEPKAVSYRLYHDQQGEPLLYTMEHLPGDYIEVDQATYIKGSFGVRVINGALTVLPSQPMVKKLRSGVADGTPCDPRDICVVVSDHREHTRWGYQNHDVS